VEVIEAMEEGEEVQLKVGNPLRDGEKLL